MRNELKKYDEHFFNYYLIQTAVTALIIGLLSVDRERYSGWSLIGTGLILALCFFVMMVMFAMDAYEKDEKDQMKAEKMEQRKKIAEKKSA